MTRIFTTGAKGNSLNLRDFFNKRWAPLTGLKCLWNSSLLVSGWEDKRERERPTWEVFEEKCILYLGRSRYVLINSRAVRWQHWIQVLNERLRRCGIASWELRKNWNIPIKGHLFRDLYWPATSNRWSMVCSVPWHIIVELNLSFVSPWHRKRVHRISKAIVVKSIHGFCYAYVVHVRFWQWLLDLKAEIFYLLSRS